MAILNEDDNCVACLGDGKGVKEDEFRASQRDKFAAPHALYVDSKGSLYVLDWVPYGRVRKFTPTPA